MVFTSTHIHTHGVQEDDMQDDSSFGTVQTQKDEDDPIRLAGPSPELLPGIAGLRLGHLVVQDGLKTGGEVHVLCLDKLASVLVCTEGVESKEEGNGEVVCDKVRSGPVAGQEGGPSTEEDDERSPDDGVPREEGTSVRLEGQDVVGETLGRHTLAE